MQLYTFLIFMFQQFTVYIILLFHIKTMEPANSKTPLQFLYIQITSASTLVTISWDPLRMWYFTAGILVLVYNRLVLGSAVIM